MTTTIRSLATSGAIAVNGVDQLKVKDDGKLEVRVAGDSGLEVATAGQLLGTGQTWQDMFASRALSTTYTNTTGKPIVVSVCCGISSGSLSFACIVNGVTVIFLSTGPGVTASRLPGVFVVPPGATYSVTMTNASIAIWTELRA